MGEKKILLLIGVFLALALFVNSQILLEKNNYEIDELVLIELSGNYTKLEILGPKLYHFFNPQPLLRFYPKFSGTYELNLYDNDEIIDTTRFNVSGNQKKEKLVFDSLKKIYKDQEKVQLRINKLEPDYYIKINVSGKNYILYDLKNQVLFTPKDSGMHEASLYKGITKIASTYFLIEAPKLKLLSKNFQSEFNLTKIKDKHVLKFKDSKIEKIEFNKLSFDQEPVLRIDDDVEKKFNIEDRKSVKTYAIDPSQAEFTDAIVTVEATGTELWKCKDWDYDQQICLGSWVKLRDVTPGQNYSFLLTALDPGFAETNWWNTTWKKRIEINITENSNQDLYEYQIKFNFDTKSLISQGLLNHDCSDIRFVDEDNNLLSHFTDVTPRYKCNTTETLFWVKTNEILADTTTSVYMYYNNSDASDASNKTNVFTYNSSKMIYYVVGENIDTTNLAIVSYVDNNDVSIGSTKSRTIDRSEVNTDFLSTDTSEGTGFNVTGPIIGGALASNGDGDALMPISWAGTDFILRLTRNNVLAFYVYAPFCDADVTFTSDTSAATNWGAVDETLSVNEGTVKVTTTANWPLEQSMFINASCPVLVYMQDEASGDEYNTPIYPMTDDIWGIRTFEVANFLAANSVQTLGSDNTNSTVSRGETDNWQGTGGSSDGRGTAYHLVSEGVSIGGMESADSDGSEEAFGLPEYELETEYFMYDSGQYIAGAVSRASTDCRLINPSDVEQESGTSTQTGAIDYPFPSKIYFGDGTGNPGDNYYQAGSRIECDEPFYMYFEDNYDDEEMTYGWKSARQYVYPEPTLIIGSVEQEPPIPIIKAEFNETPASIIQDESILFYSNCSNNNTEGILWTEVNVILQFNDTGDFTEVNLTGGLYANTSSYFIGNLSGGENSSTYTFKITGDAPGKYAFRAVCNSTNYIQINSSVHNLTLLDVVQPTLYNIRNESITDVTAVILWETNELSNSTVLYGETTAFSENQSLSDLVTSHSVPLTGLSADTLYYYNVSSCDPSGNCNSTGIFNFTTSSIPDTTPPALFNVNVSDITETTAKINWSTNEAANSTIIYGETINLGQNKTRAFYVTERSITIGSLNPNTFYYFNLTSCDLAGNCNTSGYFNFTTIDTTNPTVSLEFPSDDAFINMLPVQLKFNVTDNDDVQNCTIYGDFEGSWQDNETVYDPELDSSLTVSIYLSTGTYNWNVLCYDNVGNYDWFNTNYTFNQEDRIMSIFETVLPNGTDPLTPVSVFGHINLSDGNDVANKSVFIYLNETLLTNFLGDGRDGYLTVSSGNQVLNDYSYIAENVSSGQIEIKINDTTDFSIGDLVLVHQTQNGTTNCVAGTYEFLKISDIEGYNLTFENALENNYCFNNPNTVSTDCTDTINGFDSAVAQIVRVPQYTYVVVQDGASITAPAWNGYYGGIVAFKAMYDTTINGKVDVKGKGFRGGQDGIGDDAEGGTGEGVAGWGYNPEAGDYPSGDWEVAGNCMQDPNGMGGSGSWCSNDNGGDPGAGGGYGTAGESMAQDQGQPISEGGYETGTIDLSRMYFGGGGGAGSDNDNADPEGDGGEGGGIIYIASNTISGNVTASGHEGYGDSGSATSATGGGGAGGSVWLRAFSMNLGIVNATGGRGGNDGSEPGGIGGDGRIRLDYITLEGSTIPEHNYTGVYNMTYTNDTGHYNFNFTAPLLQGIYKVWVNSTFNTLVSKLVYNNLVVDSINPNASIDIIQPNPSERIHEDVEVNFSVSDVHLNYYYVNVTYPNSTLLDVFYNNFTLTKENLSVGGEYNISLYAIDLGYNINITSLILTVEDTLLPNNSNLRNESITNESALIKWDTNEPTNGTVFYSETLFFTESTSHIDFREDHSIPLTGLTPNTFYYYYIRSCDPYENCRENSTFNFTTEGTGDRDAPEFSNINVSEIQETSVRINWTTDENANSTVYYNETKLLEFNITDSTYVLEHSMVISGLDPNTFYFFNVSSCDLSGNCNSSVIYNFTTIDITEPNITALIHPYNNFKFNRSLIDFNFTANDNDEIVNCSLWTDITGSFAKNETITNIVEDEETKISINVPDGNYKWNIECIDLSGNKGRYETNYTVKVDITDPDAFSLVSPGNNSFESDYTPYLTWTATSDPNFKNYTILVDDDIDFTSINYVYSTTGFNYYQVEDAWTVNDTFYWKVIAYDSMNNSYSTGAYNYFTLPVNVTVSININPKYIKQKSIINISGKVNLTSGDILRFNPIYVYVNDTLLVMPGDGTDGEFTVSTANYFINNYTHVTDSSVPSGSTRVNVLSTSEFKEGDEILILQTQDSTNPGRYEFLQNVTIIDSNTLNFSTPTTYSYSSGSYDSENAVSTQIIRVPHYLNLTIQNSASVIAKDWDGYSGGVVVFRVRDTLTFLGTGNINVSESGFRGGGCGDCTSESAWGENGEGITGLGSGGGAFTPDNYPDPDTGSNGGVGGYGPSGIGGEAGGGGSYGTIGGNASGDYEPAAAAGDVVGSANLSLIMFGGAGGGGGDNDGHTPFPYGGNGSGSVVVFAGNIVDASIFSQGGPGINSSVTTGGKGGGGAGGTIWVSAYNITISELNATGGPGSNQDGDLGGDGGDGRIRLDYYIITGNSDPGSGYNASPYTMLTDANALYEILIDSYEVEGAYEIRINSSYMNKQGQGIDYYYFDLTEPGIILNKPDDDANYSDYAVISYNWTAFDNFASQLLCNVSIDDIVQNPLPIISLNNTIQNYTIANPYGYYEWNVTCWDNVTNVNTSETRNFTILTYPRGLRVNLTNDQINLSWDSALYADSYSIYITKNYTEGFSNIANYTGITELSWQDPDSFNDTTRYYRVATAKGQATSINNKTGGIQTRFINSTWSLISIPFNITDWKLYDGTNGRDIYSKPDACINSLWYYNETNQSYLRTDYLAGIWSPAIGSEYFTELEKNRGYWLELNQDCNISFYGIVPEENSTIELQEYWNIVGQYSAKNQLLYDESVSKVIDVYPQNSTSAILRYNTLKDKFEVTVHWPGFGWFPSFNNQDFLYLKPSEGYYFDQLVKGNWTHDPEKN